MTKIASKLSIAAWIIAMFGLMFQCFYPILSAVIIPAVIVYLLLNINYINFNPVRGWINMYVAYVLFLTISALLSAFTSNILSHIIRFYLILLILPVYSLLQKPEMRAEWNVFKILSTIKAVIIIYIWLQIIISHDYSEYRSWIGKLGTGDIYIVNGQAKVQLIGSTLFVLAVIIDFFKEQRLTPFCILMITASVASGNSAYILGIALVFGAHLTCVMISLLKRRSWKFAFIIIILIIAIIVFSVFSINTFQRKAAFSNAIRYDQARLLLDTNWLFGEGLGNSIIANTRFITYDSDMYFELQTLYIFNQIGIIGLLAFYILTAAPLVRKNNPEMVTAYIIFLIYTFWNPYCFDSNHIVALILIRNVLYKTNADLKKE